MKSLNWGKLACKHQILKFSVIHFFIWVNFYTDDETENNRHIQSRKKLLIDKLI